MMLNNPMESIDVAEFRRRIQDSGLRLTQPRLRILDALTAMGRPVGAYDLHAEMTAAGQKVNIVSIYRTLSAFQELGIIHYIPSQQGYLVCTSDCKDDLQTEHLVCEQCGDVSELPIPECATKDLRQQADSQGFRPNKIRVELGGVCGKCQGA